MLYELSGPAASSYVKKRFYLSDRTPEEKLSFIVGNSRVDWNSNKDYVGDNYPHPEIVRVERNGKYGLFEYDIDFDMKSPYKEEDSDVSSSKRFANMPTATLQVKNYCLLPTTIHNNKITDLSISI